MKKIMLLTLVTSALSVSLPLTAETNFLTIIGGGGEPSDVTTTQFDKGISNLSVFYNGNKNNYKTTVNFNGGHSQTESMIREKYQGAEINNGFNEESFNGLVVEYIRKLSATPPEIKPGEKIMLFISDHGGESDQKTHKISASNSALTNYNSGNKDGMISLDKLEDLSAAAKKANVKLAIIDASCHSGNSLVLANEKTCVITASGPMHYGYTNFAEIFANNMEAGKNLEEVFLKTREVTNGDGFPEISTPEWTTVQDSLYPLLTPYMYYHDEFRGMALDKIDTYLKVNSQVGINNFCARQNEFVQLTTLLTLIEDVNSIEKKAWLSKNITKVKTIDLTELKNKITQYRTVQEDYIKRLQEISKPFLNKREPMDTTGGHSPGYTHKELLDGDWNYYVAEKEKDLLDETLSISKRRTLEDVRDFYKVSQVTKDKILREHPEYQKYQSILDELKVDTRVSRSIGSSIASEANKAYTAYYKNQQTKRTESDKKATNACKDFVL